jgi:hypothetical protein
MTDKPHKETPVVRELPLVSELGSAHAPFLYFEDASAFGHINGIIRVTLEATRLYPEAGEHGAKIERVVVGHLRMNIPAARSLRAALDGALFLATPPETASKN